MRFFYDRILFSPPEKWLHTNSQTCLLGHDQLRSQVMPIPPTQLKPWTLISTQLDYDNAWFPIEKRHYQLPNGKTVPDFTITTIPDVAMIIPITTDGKIVMVRQYKPGIGEIMIEFPGGRQEPSHANLEETARHELEEETGIAATTFHFLGTTAGFVTKATEKIYCYLAPDVIFNSQQKLDSTEEIEILQLTPSEVEGLMTSSQSTAAISVAAWVMAKQHYPQYF